MVEETPELVSGRALRAQSLSVIAFPVTRPGAVNAGCDLPLRRCECVEVSDPLLEIRGRVAQPLD